MFVPDDDEEIVATPAGPRPRKSVHAVSPHQAIIRTPAGDYSVVEQSPESSEGGSVMEEPYVITPGGARPKSLVHQIEPGTILDASGARHRKLHANGKV